MLKYEAEQKNGITIELAETGGTITFPVGGSVKIWPDFVDNLETQEAGLGVLDAHQGYAIAQMLEALGIRAEDIDGDLQFHMDDYTNPHKVDSSQIRSSLFGDVETGLGGLNGVVQAIQASLQNIESPDWADIEGKPENLITGLGAPISGSDSISIPYSGTAWGGEIVIQSASETVAGLMSTTDKTKLGAFQKDTAQSIADIENSLKGKVDTGSLGAVAFSNDYNDLKSKPVIDSTPISGSGNLISSGAVYAGLVKSGSDLQAHLNDYANPHKVGSAQVGSTLFGNVETGLGNLNSSIQGVQTKLQDIGWTDIKNKPDDFIVGVGGVTSDSSSVSIEYIGEKASRNVTLTSASETVAGLMNSADKAKLDAIPSDTVGSIKEIESSLAKKPDTSAFGAVAFSNNYQDLNSKPAIDTVPASGSGNLITSGAVYTELGAVKTDLQARSDDCNTSLAKKADASSLGTVAFSNNYNDLDSRPMVDTAPVSGSGNLITSGVVYSELGSVRTDYLPKSEKGNANGVAELDENGKVLSSQLPGYVDDVLEFDSTPDFPQPGESGKIYIATDTNMTYRWGGSAYVPIGGSGTGGELALGETSYTAYRGDRGQIAYDHSQESGNPHGTVISWGDVSGTLPQQTDLQAALDTRLIKPTTTNSYLRVYGDNGTPPDSAVAVYQIANAPEADTIPYRDASGRFKAGYPAAEDDVATMGYMQGMASGLDSQITDLRGQAMALFSQISDLKLQATTLSAQITDLQDQSPPSMRITLLASGWAGDLYTVPNSIFIANDNLMQIWPEEDFSLKTGTTHDAWTAANIWTDSQANGSVTIKAWDGAPTIDLPIVIKMRRYTV